MDICYDILHEILQNLNAKEIALCMSVSKMFYSVCISKNLWRKLLEVGYGSSNLFSGDYNAYKICDKLDKFRRAHCCFHDFRTFCERSSIILTSSYLTSIPAELGQLIDLQNIN